ncbi:MAG: sigma 54-interacting transcriptional regulator [Ahrensia sp.]|nr:sigma 54-interacting transcriptional regulator [Ahrensia sp.]
MLHENLKVGLIEDDPIMGESIVQRLTIEGCSVNWYQTGKEALASADLASSDIVVCDIRLPDMVGADIFQQLLIGDDTPPFIFVTGYGEIEQAVQLMQMGAVDYLQKPFEFEEFHLRLKQNARRGHLTTQEFGMLGVSPQMREAEKLLENYAGNDLPVMITGETGSGKEVTARLLHTKSGFAQGPFMAVNCAAIPAELLESEIFGHEKGAFTGANRQHAGYAERTGKGTLF